MEFDADRYEAEVAGSGQFARTTERLCELQVAFEKAFLSVLDGTLTPFDTEFAVVVADLANQLSEREHRRVAKMLAPQRAQWFDSHPSPTERIAAVASQSQPGIFQLAGPARCLLNEAALARAQN
jgi:Zn-dependent protease with chaperone function